MDSQELQKQIENNTAGIEATRKAVGNIIGILERISSAVDEGFEKVHQRLSILEGKDGMQGVNMQLGDIKNELHKIQKAYPYEDLINNMKSIQGEA
jgi:hypothetical protein